MQNKVLDKLSELEKAISNIKNANKQANVKVKPKTRFQSDTKVIENVQEVSNESQGVKYELSVVEKNLVPSSNNGGNGNIETYKGQEKEKKRFDIVKIVKDLAVSGRKHRTQPQNSKRRDITDSVIERDVIEADFVEVVEESGIDINKRCWNRQEAYRFMLMNGFDNVEATIIAKAMEQISVDEKILKISVGNKPISVLFQIDPLDIGLSISSGVNVLHGGISTKTSHVLTNRKIRELLRQVYMKKPKFSVFKNNNDYVNRHNERVLQALLEVNYTKIEVDYIK